MNDIIAKKVNDSYLTRCAQILSSRDNVKSFSINDHGKDRTFFFVKSNGIKMPDGSVIPYEDGLGTIGIVRNKQSITMFLVGTNFKIDLFATFEKCYFRNKELGIELKYENRLLSKEHEVEKNYFQFVGPQKTICTTYALNEAGLLEFCYYYEKIEVNDEAVENSIINKAIAEGPDEAIVSHMKSLYDAYTECRLENETDDGEIEYEENKAPETVVDERSLRIVINPSFKQVEKEGETIELSKDVHDYYQTMYGEAMMNGEDCFVVSDMFGNMIDTSDEEENYEEFDEYSSDDEQYDDEIDDENELGVGRFKFVHRKNDDKSQFISIPASEKDKIIQAISEYVVLRDFEFSNMKSLVQAIIDEFKTIEAQIGQEVVTPVLGSDEIDK